MNFITRYLKNHFVSCDAHSKKASELEAMISNVYSKMVDTQNRQGELYGDTATMKNFLGSLNERIAALEEKLENDPKIVLHKDYDKKDEVKDGWLTTDAIIDVLKKQDGKKLHYTNIYALIKSYNLFNPAVDIKSVQSTLYILATKNKISKANAPETGTFFIKTKKGS